MNKNRKYDHELIAWMLGDSDCWEVLHLIDREKFNFKWRPHPWDPPYIYVWGNQLLGAADMPTVEYHTPGAAERKYMTDSIAIPSSLRKIVPEKKMSDRKKR